MQYMGGKSRLAKQIVANLPLSEVDEVWEPFMGGGAVTIELARVMRLGQKLVASDMFPPLIAMWKAAMSGWLPPDVTESDHESARALPDTDPLKAFVGFGCSFGGHWFRGFARSAGRDHCSESRRNLLRYVAALRSSSAEISIEQRDFFSIEPPRAGRRVLIYCDPPYAGTEVFPTGPFDHYRFWSRCVELRRAGALVYVSEFTAPDFAKQVWGKERMIRMSSSLAMRKYRSNILFEAAP